jgi:hypothetical protein
MLRRLILVIAVVAAGAAVVTLEVSRPGPRLTPPPTLGNPPPQCDKFAAEHGSDAARGTWRRPFRTAQRLARSLRRGQTGCLRRGTYATADDEGYVLRIGSSGITIMSYPGERALVKGLVQVTGADDVRLSRLQFEGTGGGTVSMKAWGDNFVLEDSEITNQRRGDSCLQLGSGDGASRRPVIRRNKFHDCGSSDNENHDHGIYALRVSDGLITDNLFWNIQAYATQLYPDTHRTVFSHNVVDGASPSIRGGVVIGGDDNDVSTDNVIEHNVLAYAATHNLTVAWDGDVGSGNIARRNCLWQAQAGDIDVEDGGVQSVGNVVADPLFVNREQRDLRLGAASGCRSVVGYDTAAKLARP